MNGVMLTWWKAAALAALFVAIAIPLSTGGWALVESIEGMVDPDGELTQQGVGAILSLNALGIVIPALLVLLLGRRHADCGQRGLVRSVLLSLRFLGPALLLIAGTTLVESFVLGLLPISPDRYQEFAGKLAVVPLWLAILTAVVVPAVFEEIAFRGVIQPGLVRRYGPIGGIILAAILFSAVHIEPYQMVSVLLGGLVLGYLRHATGSLGPAVLAHGLGNLVAVMAVRYADMEATRELALNELAAIALWGAGLVWLGVYLCRRLQRSERQRPC